MARSDIEILSDGVTALRASVDSLTREIQVQSAFAKRSRTLIMRQWVPIVAVIVLALALGAIAFSARHTAQVAKDAATTAQRNAVNAHDNCVTSNKARQVTTDLWNFALNSAIPSFPVTPQQEAAREALLSDLRARVATAYAQQDCSKVAPK